MPIETLKLNLKAIRKHYGLTQKQFANSIGIDKKLYEAWEYDRSSPQTIHLIAIKHVYKISINELCRKVIIFQTNNK